LGHDRLTRPDALLLYMDSPTVHMYMGGALILDWTAVDIERVKQVMLQKMPFTPRFRQRVRSTPLALHRPVWVDDPTFDIDHHVRHISLPPPGSEQQLLRLSEHIMGTKLDMNRPPWEMWFVDGLEGGRSAMLGKMHHVISDGVSAANNTMSQLDLTAEPVHIEPYAWTASPLPRRAGLVAEALRARASEAAALFGRLREEGVRARMSGVASAFRAVKDAATNKGAVTPLNTTIGAQRRHAMVRARLEDLKLVRSILGGTVNDVALAVVAGGMARWLEHRGIEPMELRTVVPKSLREDPTETTFDNRVSTMFARMPAQERDPIRRLELVREAMEEAKSSGSAGGIDALTNFVPAGVLATLMRLPANKRVFNMSVSNVPGPPVPLYYDGHEVLEFWPMTPLGGPLAAMTVVLSYNGRIVFGLTGDRDAVPDLDVMAHGVEDSLRELVDAARRREPVFAGAGEPALDLITVS
jgi:WS/DGAT/MGAT family acyltransferase